MEHQSMSYSKSNIAAFVELLEKQASLFSQDKLDELRIVINSLTDDIEVISRFISEWCTQHLEINYEQSKLRNQKISDNNYSASIRILPTEKGYPNEVPILDSHINKQIILNAIETATKLVENNQYPQS
ncbi:MAG: hypothetical protein HC908_11060 [Calothrix sp. SM1_7_51]|nr:hypothetical protein [Calothrix sp. SM1_7_51]